MINPRLVVAASAALLVALSSAPLPVQAATAVAGRGHKDSHFQLVPVSRLGRAAPAKSGSPLFRGGVRPRASTARAASSTASTSSTSSPDVALYNGLNQPGIPASANGFQTTPPDSTGAIGPNNYVEMANSIIHVWDRNLSSISSAGFSTFLGLSNPWCDPQVQWDQAANRWLFVILLCNGQTPTPQGFVLGWSRTADPSQLNLSPGGWCAFGVDTASTLFDYPKLGHNSKYLIVGGNFYDTTGLPASPPFVGAQLAWVPLPANSDTTCPAEPLGHTNAPLMNGDGVSNTFTPVPVNTDSGATDGYIVSAYDPSGSNNQAPGSKNKLAVWHLDSVGMLHQDADIAVNGYSAPPAAAQLGTTDVLDTLDGRLTQAVGDPSTGIWTQHTVFNSGVSKVTWYELARPGSSLALTQEGDITGAAGEYIFDAAISPSLNAHGAAIVYARSSASIHPLIGVRLRITSTPASAMEPGELVLASSPAADTDFSCIPTGGGPPCRWGDYSGASPDPVQPYAVWGTSEFITASGSVPAWQNENFAVLIYAPPAAPINIGAVAGDTFACVYWTPAGSNDGGFPDISYKIRVYSGVSVVATVIVNTPALSACIRGLTDGTAYTFTVAATDLVGESAESAPSNSVTPKRAITQSAGGTPPTPRSGANQGPAGSPGPR